MNNVSVRVIMVTMRVRELGKEFSVYERRPRNGKRSHRWTFALRTLGCKVNQYEGESVARELADFGLTRVDFDDVADVYVINGCTVTGTADHKARQLIRRAHRRNPAALIAVTGCYAEGARAEAERLLGGSGIIVGNADKGSLAARIADRLGLSGDGRAAPSCAARPSVKDQSEANGGHSRALVKVQDGCNSFCSYCIVPLVRGRLSSKPLELAVSEVRSLAADGGAEVVLTGIHLGHYGADLSPRRSLDDLLAALAVARAPRIRLSSIEVLEITPKIVELMSSSGAICRHLHVPLQSGSDRILRAMNRRYTAEKFIEICGRIKEAVPDIAITTDVMVGFPGETEEDFEETLRVVEKVGFSKVHAFRFSPRPGTPAAEMDGQVEPGVKEERLRELVSLADWIATEYASRFVGKELDVVVEERESGTWAGTSDNYLRVKFDGPAGIAGKRLKVRAIESSGSTIYGKLMGEG